MVMGSLFYSMFSCKLSLYSPFIVLPVFQNVLLQRCPPSEAVWDRAVVADFGLSCEFPRPFEVSFPFVFLHSLILVQVGG